MGTHGCYKQKGHLGQHYCSNRCPRLVSRSGSLERLRMGYAVCYRLVKIKGLYGRLRASRRPRVRSYQVLPGRPAQGITLRED